MNAAAFRRGEAITRLENYATVIVEHLALTAWYPGHPAFPHWQAELNAFCTTMRRFNTAKKSKGNYTFEIIVDALMEILMSNEDKDYLLIGVESHGVVLAPEPDWTELNKSIENFANKVLRSKT